MAAMAAPLDPEALFAEARALRERVRGRLTARVLGEARKRGRP